MATSRLIHQETFARLEEHYRKSPFEYEETAPIQQTVLVVGYVVAVGNSSVVETWLERRHPDIIIQTPSAAC